MGKLHKTCIHLELQLSDVATSCEKLHPPTDHRNMFRTCVVLLLSQISTNKRGFLVKRRIFLFIFSKHCLVFWWIMFSLAEKANFPSLLGSAGQIFAAIRAGGWRPPTSCFYAQLTQKTFSVSRVSVLTQILSILIIIKLSFVVFEGVAGALR